MVLVFQSHNCNRDLSGYVCQFSYIADGCQADQKLARGQQDI